MFLTTIFLHSCASSPTRVVGRKPFSRIRSTKGKFWASVESSPSVSLRGGEAEEARRLRLDEEPARDSEDGGCAFSSTSGKRGIEYTVMFSSA